MPVQGSSEALCILARQNIYCAPKGPYASLQKVPLLAFGSDSQPIVERLQDAVSYLRIRNSNRHKATERDADRVWTKCPTCYQG
jgi:hypothetical protein